MKFLIDNILIFSLITVLLIHLSYWILDKIKVKKNILDMKSNIINIKKDICIMQDSISKLRNSNHNIANIVNKLNIKAQYDESNNKTD